jgi:hypothetical protein
VANRTGQGQSIPEFERQDRLSSDIPRIKFATQSAANPAAGQAGNTLAALLSDMSNNVEDRLDIHAEIEGRDAGQVAGENGIPERQDDATIRGRAHNRAASDAIAVQYELKSRQALQGYENESGLDTVKFQQSSDAYLKGATDDLAKFDRGMSQRFAAKYQLQQSAAINRITKQRNAVQRDNMLEDSLKLQAVLEKDLAQQADALFSAEASETQNIIADMMASSIKMRDLAHQIGPDGQPLFKARERVSFELAAQQAVAENIGQGWLRSQDDKLKALDEWRNGDPVIELADDQGNTQKLSLREFLGDSGFRDAEKSFIQNLKGELALQAQIDAAEDRQFKESSTELYSDLSVLAQDGRLSLSIVEASRASLEPEKYLALRELARGGGATVSNGGVVSMLTVMDADNQDIRPMVIQAYKDGQLKNEDFLKLYDRNTKRLDGGQRDPIANGRDHVGNSLGRLSSELGFAQSLSIPQAESEYEQRVDNFVTENQRKPSLPETMDIARDIVRRYSFIDTDTSIANLPLPLMMSPAQKFSGDLNANDVQDTIRATNQEFLKRHNGNAAAMQEDEIYQREVTLLKQYYDLLKVRDGNARKQ